MAKEIAFENGRISNFEGLVTLTLDRVILHTGAPLIDLYPHAKFNWSQRVHLKTTPEKPSIQQQTDTGNWRRKNLVLLALLVWWDITAGKTQHSLRTQQQRSVWRSTKTLWLWTFDLKQRDFPDSSWNIYMPRLAILAASVLEIYSGKYRQTNSSESSSHSTAVGMGKSAFPLLSSNDQQVIHLLFTCNMEGVVYILTFLTRKCKQLYQRADPCRQRPHVAHNYAIPVMDTSNRVTMTVFKTSYVVTLTSGSMHAEWLL